MESLIPLIVIVLIIWFVVSRFTGRGSGGGVGAAFPQPPKLKNNGEETDPRCPHCQYAFEVMPKGRRKCPECREWICVSKPPDMKHKRLVTDKQSRQWRLDKASDDPFDIGFGVALEKARQGLPFQDDLRAAHRNKLLEFLEDEKALGEPMLVEVAPAQDCCPECRKLSTKPVPVREELRTQRLPCRECTSPLHRHDNVIGWCRCNYLPH